jgi:hypothetical protein
MSEEEYLRTAYEPDAEFVDGVIEKRNMGDEAHSAWQMALYDYFSLHAHAASVSPGRSFVSQ